MLHVEMDFFPGLQFFEGTVVKVLFEKFISIVEIISSKYKNCFL